MWFFLIMRLMRNFSHNIINVSRTVALIAVYAIPFSALVVSDSLFFPFIIGKAVMFRALVEIAFFAWVLLALFDYRYRLRDSKILFVFSLFVVWIFIADLFAVNSHKAFWGNFERMEGWITLLHLFLFFIVSGSLLRTRKLWNIFWFISLGISIIISFDAFLDIAHTSSGTRVGGMFGNPIYLAAYALFHVFIAAYYFFNNQITSRLIRFFLFVAALLNIIILFYSGTRSAFLGLFVGVIISTSSFFIIRYGVGKKTFKLIIAILIIALSIFFLARSPLLRDVFPFSRIASISIDDGKTRITLWQMAFEGAKDRPIFGWGQEGYNYVFSTYYKPSLFNQEQWFDRAHNTYIDWLIAGGIPALLLYMTIFWLVIQSIWKNEKDLIAMSLLIGAIGAYAVHSFFVFDNLITSILIIAVFAYTHTLSDASPYLLSHGAFSQKPALQFRFKYANFVIVGGVIIFFSVMQFFIIFKPLIINRELAKALHSNDAHIAIKYFKQALSYGFFKQEIREQLAMFSSNLSVISGIPDNIRIEVINFAMQEMTKQIFEAPKDARAYVMRSVVRRAAFDAQGALSDLEKAKELSPRKQVLFVEQGNIAYAIGNKQAAAHIFLQAYALDESFNEMAAYAGAGLIAIGKKQDGQAILQKHFRSISPEHPFVKKVYDDLLL